MSLLLAYRPRVTRAALLVIFAAVTIGGLGATARAAPPANDNFANAFVIQPNALPFSQSVLVNEATTEPGEPIYCSFTTQSVWYRFAPASDTWLSITGAGQLGSLTAFRDMGGGLNQLAFVTCTQFGSQTFLARGGFTYYLQAGAYCCGVTGSITVNVSQAPAPEPVAEFGYNPGDPSTFDLVQFYDYSQDPGQQGIRSRAWDFGDGSVMDTTFSPQHRFVADGDFATRLTIVTNDGRTASRTRNVTVRTHDVSITNMRTPQTAHLGQTREITVSVSNTRYPEVVRVELQRGLTGSYTSFQTVGALEQFVQVRSTRRPTDFVFSYTISPDDARLGKVTLKAVATLLGARDAYAADNEALAPPVRVALSGPVPYSGEVFASTGELEFAIMSVAPNPARAGADLAVRLSLATEGEASVQVLDLAGREVAARALGVLPPGVHETRVAWSSRPAAGMYWVRVVQSGQGSRVSRVAILD